MKQIGIHILYRAVTLSKLIALLAVVFLLCSTLDKVPDCPELLNSSRGQAASLHIVHGGNLPPLPVAPYLVGSSPAPPSVLRLLNFVERQVVPRPGRLFSPEYRASDTSPPAI